MPSQWRHLQSRVHTRKTEMKLNLQRSRSTRLCDEWWATTRHRLRRERAGHSMGETNEGRSRSMQETSATPVRHVRTGPETPSWQPSLQHVDRVLRHRLGIIPTHVEVSVHMGHHAGQRSQQRRCQNTVSDCSVIM